MRKKLFGILFALVLVLTLGLVTAVPVAAGEIAVEPGTSAVEINTAIAEATDGDIIVFAAGTYTLTESLVVAVAGVTLQGANVEVPGTGDRGAESIIDAAGIQIEADSVTVDGFTVTGAPHSAISTTSDKNTIVNNILSSNGYRGVEIGGTSGDNLIANNVMSNNIREGIYLYQDEGGNTIANNVISHSGRDGIYVSWSDGNTIARNVVSYSAVSHQGINVDNSNDNTIENNVVSYTLVDVGNGGDGHGIRLSNASRNKIKDNKITDSIEGCGIALWGGGTDNEFTGNEISGVQGCGILLTSAFGQVGTCSGTAITGNTITGSDGAAINIFSFVGAATTTINYNNFEGNGSGLSASGVDDTLNATSNWWGDASGPYHPVGNPDGSGNAVSNDVRFDPWLYSFYTAEPGTAALTMTATFAPSIGISVSPTSVNFRDIAPGVPSHQMVAVRNTGTIPEDFSASLTNISTPDVYTTGLAIEGSSVDAWNVTNASPETYHHTGLTLTVPAGTDPGTYTATLIFWAIATP